MDNVSELVRLVGENVMGWHMAELSCGCTHWQNTDGQGMGDVELWWPDEDLDAAWQVKQAMNARGYGCTIRDGTTNGGPVHVLFWQDVKDGESYKMYVQSRAQADTLPRAMCEAALQAVTTPLGERVGLG